MTAVDLPTGPAIRHSGCMAAPRLSDVPRSSTVRSTALDPLVRREGTLSVWRGAALYVGSLIGPGVLLLPALAVQVAGPASVIGWAILLVLSAPLAYTFACLGVRLPVSGGVAAYVEAGVAARGRATNQGWNLSAAIS